MSHSKEQYSNIFDAASKLGKQKAKKEPAVAAPVPEKKELPPAGTNEELQARYERCLELHKIIFDKLESAFQEKKLSVKKIRDYFDAPQHFSKNEWMLIQEQKGEVEKMLDELVPTKEARVDKPEVKSKEHKPKSMQTKSRWLPMR